MQNKNTGGRLDTRKLLQRFGLCSGVARSPSSPSLSPVMGTANSSPQTVQVANPLTSPAKEVKQNGPVAQLVVRFHSARWNYGGSSRQAQPAPTQAAASSNGSGSTARDPPAKPTHLIILANGLFGHAENWNTIVKQLRKKLDGDQVLLHPSNVNRRTDTYDGIDVCGWRLAEEIQTVVNQNPSLERISVVGHSMGGLLLRFAIGVSFDPSTGRVAGLQPCHFVTLATPHLGCDAEGLSQVPFIGWLGIVQPLQKLFTAISVPTAGALFKRTGKQFFMADDDTQRATGVAALPLLARMTRDVPERKEYFLTALSSFASRTAYANTGGDHLVGWANSSLRFMHQLPELPPSVSSAKGVVLEDTLMAAFDVRFKPDPEPQAASSPEDLPIDCGADGERFSCPSSPRHSTDLRRNSEETAQRRFSSEGQQGAGVARAGNGGTGSGGSRQSQSRQFASHASDSQQPPAANASVGRAELDSKRAAGLRAGGTGAQSQSEGQGEGGPLEGDNRGQLVEGMLQRLQSLPWRRIDVSFKGAVMPLAHNHIQVTRRWLNFEGESVAIHLAEQMAVMDLAWVSRHAPATASGSGREGVSAGQPEAGPNVSVPPTGAREASGGALMGLAASVAAATDKAALNGPVSQMPEAARVAGAAVTPPSPVSPVSGAPA